jgi:hypothetical protein
MSEPSLLDNLAREPQDFSPAFGRQFLAMWGVCIGVSWAATLANPFMIPPGSLLAIALAALSYLFLAVANGAAMAAFTILLPSIFSTSERRRLTPVKWLLLAWGANAIAGCLFIGGVGLWYRAGFLISSFGLLERGCNALAVGAMSIFSACGLANARNQRWWWIYFFSHTLASVLAGVTGVIETISFVQSRFASPGYLGASEYVEIVAIPSALNIAGGVMLAAYTALTIALVIDIRLKQQRDWLDKLGIALVVMYPVACLVSMLPKALHFHWFD